MISNFVKVNYSNPPSAVVHTDQSVAVLISLDGEEGFRLSCLDCKKPDETIKVYPINLGIYRGTCVRCKKVVHEGTTGCELFDGS